MVNSEIKQAKTLPVYKKIKLIFNLLKINEIKKYILKYHLYTYVLSF